MRCNILGINIDSRTNRPATLSTVHSFTGCRILINPLSTSVFPRDVSVGPVINEKRRFGREVTPEKRTSVLVPLEFVFNKRVVSTRIAKRIEKETEKLRQTRTMTRARLLLLIFAAQSFLVPSFCAENDEDREILRHLLPAYAIASNAKLLNSSRCGKELEELRAAIDDRHLWSLKVLDSSGEPKSGFMYGNNYWLGTRSQCIDTMNRNPMILAKSVMMNNSRYRPVEDEFPPFDVHYFVAHFRHNSTLQYHVRLPNEDLITLGLCLPASCTSNELATILESIFQNRSLLFGDLYSADFRLLEVKDGKEDHRWLANGAFIVIMLISVVTLLLMIAGTVHEVLTRKKNSNRKKFHNCENNNTSLQLSTKPSYEDPEEQRTKLKPQGTLGQVLQSFSIYTNTKIIFSTKLPSDSIPVIHGLRFLSMVWIILVHTALFAADTADNKAWSWRKGESFADQVLSNATLVVDTFFFLSGFLITHMYMLNQEKENAVSQSNFLTEAKMLFLIILKRFIRLTPAYMMTIGLFQMNSKWYSMTSQFYMAERGYEVCPKYWWMNLLYIQNLFSQKDMCMSWSWYLANDMQFFVISIFLLKISTKNMNVAIGLLSVIFAGSTIVTGYISYVNEYIPTMDGQYNNLELLYFPPWTRIGPYLVGMVTGYIYLKLDKNLRLKRRTVVILWILGSACNVSVLFGLTERQISVVAAAFYSALSRTVWGVGIAWVVIACCTNNAGVIKKILSFKAWIPLSRLTYCTYLLNPMLITSAYLHDESTVHLDFLGITVTFLGNCMLSYICAYFFTLMFETPYVQLMRLTTNKKE
ncbi:hypothetical protein KPH14_005391 [Odynerus spinipes]|uniref:Nose resistant-to-fluoxetine protein N-terminal domain-containing protein n=1 Tax=Odynerus spinipes TaxID=1348599 RepID=A0AAD9RCZ4_9HYME|nr:hypothetical protein KPH14_005391 [Odynerus spinipes]